MIGTILIPIDFLRLKKRVWEMHKTVECRLERYSCILSRLVSAYRLLALYRDQRLLTLFRPAPGAIFKRGFLIRVFSFHAGIRLVVEVVQPRKVLFRDPETVRIWQLRFRGAQLWRWGVRTRVKIELHALLLGGAAGVISRRHYLVFIEVRMLLIITRGRAAGEIFFHLVRLLESVMILLLL